MIKIYNTETIIIKQIIYILRVSTLILYPKVPRVPNLRFGLTGSINRMRWPYCATRFTSHKRKMSPSLHYRTHAQNIFINRTRIGRGDIVLITRWNIRITYPTCSDLCIWRVCFRFNSKSDGMQNVLRRIVAALVILCPVIAFSIPESAIQASSIKSSQTEQVHTTIILRNRFHLLHFHPSVPPVRPSTAK